MSGALQFTVSPDFGPERIADWYLVNTWLQHATGQGIHLELYDTFGQQREAIQDGRVDLIYANPFDAAMLMRTCGFVPLVKAAGDRDEAVLAVAESSSWRAVEELPSPLHVAATDDPDMRLIGMILLEPGDFDSSNIKPLVVSNYVKVAKSVLNGEADVGIFYQRAFDELSGLVRRQLRPIVASDISVVHHLFMAGPRLASVRDQLTRILEGMHADPAGREPLAGLGIAAWQAVHDEEAEFMIDLMDTLQAV